MRDLAPDPERAFKERVIARLAPARAKGLARKSDDYVNGTVDGLFAAFFCALALARDAGEASN